MWHITALLQKNPKISDADIKRSIRSKFLKKDGTPEAVSDGIIREARWIFARKLENGEIVVEGQRAYLSDVQRNYLALTTDDRNAFLTWLHYGAREEEVRRPTESVRDFNGRRSREQRT
jgi:hypothetical protein